MTEETGKNQKEKRQKTKEEINLTKNLKLLSNATQKLANRLKIHIATLKREARIKRFWKTSLATILAIILASTCPPI